MKTFNSNGYEPRNIIFMTSHWWIDGKIFSLLSYSVGGCVWFKFSGENEGLHNSAQTLKNAKIPPIKIRIFANILFFLLKRPDLKFNFHRFNLIVCILGVLNATRLWSLACIFHVSTHVQTCTSSRWPIVQKLYKGWSQNLFRWGRWKDRSQTLWVDYQQQWNFVRWAL